MRSKIIFFLAVSMVGGVFGQTPLPQAQENFRQGRFPEAEKQFGDAVGQEPGNYEALLGLGKLRLYANRYAEAESLLKKAQEAKPEEAAPKLLLAELYYRQNRFADAEPLFRAAGRKATADKLAGFAGKEPYRIEGSAVETIVPFIQTDPLPVVSLRLNGKEGFFLIDTGGPELIVAPEFAAAAGARKIVEAAPGGVMAGGRPAPPSVYAAVDRLQIGDFTLGHVPVLIIDANLDKLPGFTKPLSGILGTVLLSRFTFSLDYPAGRLILRKNKAGDPAREPTPIAGEMSTPFWQAGDHFLLAQGTVNGTEPHLYLLDTGLIGGGLSLPDSMIKEAEIEVSAETQTGIGGGGEVSIRNFVAREVTLGGARASEVKGVSGAMTTGMEYMLGVRLAGIISHDFFKPYKVTFDFAHMRLILQAQKK
ncbi:MAG: aspartyl protease family protein [Candidatus Aminicenantales bacterium]